MQLLACHCNDWKCPKLPVAHTDFGTQYGGTAITHSLILCAASTDNITSWQWNCEGWHTCLGWCSCSQLGTPRQTESRWRLAVCLPTFQPCAMSHHTHCEHSIKAQLSAVADRLRDADLCPLKSYQLLHETQLPQTECAMFVLYNQRTRIVGLVNCMPCITLTVDSREVASQIW